MNPNVPQKWEYSLVDVEFPHPSDAAYGTVLRMLDDRLAELGAEGWELASSVPFPSITYTRKVIFCFKRPKA